MEKEENVMTALTLIGRNTSIDFIEHASQVPAKIDTGADSSSIWASDICVNDQGILEFSLFAEGSPHYTGERIQSSDYRAALVRSSSGHEQIRYRVTLRVRMNSRLLKATFNLSDRSRNQFPALIGRRTLAGKFIVDVSKSHYPDEPKVVRLGLNDKLKKDPKAFHDTYYGKDLD